MSRNDQSGLGEMMDESERLSENSEGFQMMHDPQDEFESTNEETGHMQGKEEEREYQQKAAESTVSEALSLDDVEQSVQDALRLLDSQREEFRSSVRNQSRIQDSDIDSQDSHPEDDESDTGSGWKLSSHMEEHAAAPSYFDMVHEAMEARWSNESSTFEDSKGQSGVSMHQYPIGEQVDESESEDGSETSAGSKENEDTNAVDKSDEWKQAFTAKGRVYYYNRRTRESSWTKPNGVNAMVDEQVSVNETESTDIDPQDYLFCCFCGAKQDSSSSFQAHFSTCRPLNRHKQEMTSLFRSFQKMLCVLSEDPALRSLQYASSCAQSTPEVSSNDLNAYDLQQNLQLLPKKPVTKATPRESARLNDKPGRSIRPSITSSRNGSMSSEKNVISNVGPQEMETCKHCGRSFAMGRLAKHENVCERVFGTNQNESRHSRRSLRTNGNTSYYSNASSDTSTQSKVKSESGKKRNLALSYREYQANLVDCPSCHRKFAPSGAQQHIEICKGVENKPKNPLSTLRDYAFAG